MSGSAVSHGSENWVGISLGTDARERRGWGEPDERRGWGEPDGRRGRDAPRGSPRSAVGGTPGRGCRGPRCACAGGGRRGRCGGRREAGDAHGSLAPFPTGLRGSAGCGGRRLRPQPNPLIPSTALKSARRHRLPAPSTLLGAVRGSPWIPTPRSGCCFPKPVFPPPGAFQGRCSPGGPGASRGDGVTHLGVGALSPLPSKAVPGVSVRLRGRASCSRHLAAFLNTDPLRLFFSNSVIKATFRECA